MTVPDLINGCFEMLGSIMIWVNVVALYRDKQFMGVRIGPTAFFAAWGLWNIYYYPHLNQWLSFIGGLSIVTANLIWVGQMVYYSNRKAAMLK